MSFKSNYLHFGDGGVDVNIAINVVFNVDVDIYVDVDVMTVQLTFLRWHLLRFLMFLFRL